MIRLNEQGIVRVSIISLNIKEAFFHLQLNYFNFKLTREINSHNEEGYNTKKHNRHGCRLLSLQTSDCSASSQGEVRKK